MLKAWHNDSNSHIRVSDSSMEDKTLLLDDMEFFLERDTDTILADGENVDIPSVVSNVGVGTSNGVSTSASSQETALQETALQGGTQLNFQRSPKNYFLEKWMVKETIMLLKLALPLVSWLVGCSWLL